MRSCSILTKKKARFYADCGVSQTPRYIETKRGDFMSITSIEYLQSLVRELVKLPTETEWVEFKCNNKDPQLIGEYISALSNSATLCGRTKGYLVWGIHDDTHEIMK